MDQSCISKENCVISLASRLGCYPVRLRKLTYRTEGADEIVRYRELVFGLTGGQIIGLGTSN